MSDVRGFWRASRSNEWIAMCCFLSLIFLMLVQASSGAGPLATAAPNSSAEVSLEPTRQGIALTREAPESAMDRTATSKGTASPRLQESRSENVELVGHIGGQVRGLAVQGTYAYLGEASHLTILDISDPTDPAQVGKSAPLPGFIQDVAVEGNYAYVTTSEAGLRVLDISDPTTPHEVGAYDAAAGSIYVAGRFAYVTGGSYVTGRPPYYEAGPMRILDISNPTNPIEVGSYEMAAHDVYVVGDYAYLAGSGSVHVVDVSDPTTPLEVGSHDVDVSAYDTRSIFVAGDYAYFAYGGSFKADYWGGLVVIDVSEPTAPAKAGAYYWSGPRAWDVFVVGDSAYVAVGLPFVASGGLRVVDISQPENPYEVGSYNALDSAVDVIVSEKHAFVANEGGLWVIDVSDPIAPTEVGFYHTPARPRHVFVVGDYAYVASGYNGLSLVDVSNPATPRGMGSYYPRGVGSYYEPAEDVMVTGSYAYVGWGRYQPWMNLEYGGLRVVDVSDPTAPAEVGSYDTGYYTWDVFVGESYAYVAEEDFNRSSDQQSGLRVIDVSDPTGPVEVSRYDLPGDLRVSGVFVAGDYAYVTAQNLYVIDISDPTAPTEAGVYETPGLAVEVYVSGSTAYVADSGEGLRIIDVSDPSEPVEGGFSNTPGYVKDVHVIDDFAYVADSPVWNGYQWVGGSLLVVDVSDPAAPVAVGYYDTPGNATGVYVVGDYVYVADGNGGLLILRFTGGPACSVDEDGRVDVADIQAVAAHWRQQTTSLNGVRQFDLDDDGIVTVRDVLLVARQLDHRCP